MRLRKTFWISAGHIVHTKKTMCSRMHGHNWRIDVYIQGRPMKDGMIADFIDIKKIIVNKLDHKTILPISLISKEMANYVGFEVFGKEYLLPRSDCALLPIAAATCECIAGWICEQLTKELGIKDIQVVVHETKTSSVKAEWS